MPDISMCSNKECKDKEKCYRYMAEPSHWQSYMRPKAVSKDTCEHFVKIEKGDRIKVK